MISESERGRPAKDHRFLFQTPHGIRYKRCKLSGASGRRSGLHKHHQGPSCVVSVCAGADFTCRTRVYDFPFKCAALASTTVMGDTYCRISCPWCVSVSSIHCNGSFKTVLGAVASSLSLPRHTPSLCYTLFSPSILYISVHLLITFVLSIAPDVRLFRL